MNRASLAGLACLGCQLFVLQHSACSQIQVDMSLGYRHLNSTLDMQSIAKSSSNDEAKLFSCRIMFNLRFWLAAWRKWKNLNSAITTSGTLKIRIGKYNQTMVFDNHRIMLLPEGIFVMSTLSNFELQVTRLIYSKTSCFSFPGELPVRQHGWHRG